MPNYVFPNKLFSQISFRHLTGTLRARIVECSNINKPFQSNLNVIHGPEKSSYECIS